MSRPRARIAAAAVVAALVLLPAAALAKKHFVIVHDTSTSMRSLAPLSNDPNSAANYATLAALIFRGLLDPGDRLDIVDMGGRLFANVAAGTIRGFGYDDGTAFGDPMEIACRELAGGRAEHKILLILTDGDTNEQAAQAKARCPGLGSQISAYALSIGGKGMGFLRGVVGQRNARHVADPSGLVAAFADIFGKPMGARAQTGTARDGHAHRLPIRPYVASAYLAITAQPQRRDFRVELLGPDGQPVRGHREHGTNGQGRYYEVIKLDHPDKGDWTLRVSGATVEYVLIQRYDLELEAKPKRVTCVVGQPADFRFHLVNGRGRHFHDPSFYTEDDFRSFLIPPAGERAAPPDAQGWYVHTETPTREGRITVRARVQTTIMTLTATATCQARKPPFEAVVEIDPPSETLHPRKPGELVVRLKKPDGTPFDDARILDDPTFVPEVVVDGEVVGRPQRQPDGTFRFQWKPKTPGRHAVTVRVTYKGQTIEGTRELEVVQPDLELRPVDASPACVVGQPTVFRFHLTKRDGTHVHDPAFLAADGFQAFVAPPSGEQPATLDAQGYWETTVTPAAEGPLAVRARVRNSYLELAGEASCEVKRPPFEASCEIVPATGTLYPDEPVEIVIRLLARDGRPFDTQEVLGDPSFSAELSVGGRPIGEPVRGADDLWRYTWRPPEPGDHTITVRFGYRQESLDASRTFAVRGLGTHLTVEAPAVCWKGEVCAVRVALYETEGGALVTDPKVLGSPGFRATLTPDGEGPLTLSADPAAPGRFQVDWTPAREGPRTLVALVEGLHQRREASRAVAVRVPLKLDIPDEIDLGTVVSGTAWAETCRDLDFSASTGFEGIPFTLQPPTPPPPTGTLCSSDAGSHVVLGGGVEFVVTDEAMTVPICVETARCGPGGEVAVTLRLVPNHPKFSGMGRSITVRYRIEPLSFLDCNLWWIAIVVGTILFLLIVYGFVKPHGFQPEDRVKLAGKLLHLARASARPLREMPGGKRGFYRNASAWLNGSGAAVRGKRGALFGFEAQKGGAIRVLLVHGGDLEMRNTSTRRFEPVPREKSIELSRNRDYHLGDVYFRVVG